MAQKKLDYENPLFQNTEPTEEEQPRRKIGRPRKDGIIRNTDGGQSAQEGLTSDYTRFSVITKIENMNFIKDYAYTHRITIRTAFDEIIEDFFRRYNKNPKNEPLLDHRKGRKWN